VDGYWGTVESLRVDAKNNMSSSKRTMRILSRQKP
jgi:hypothetical protein